MQAVVITMAAGDEIRAEAGAMTFMTDGIDMDARMTGGLLGGLTRKFLAGESLFLTYFKCAVASGKVAGPVAREKSLFAGTFGWMEGLATLRFAAFRCASANGIAQTATSRSR